jgi:hypothetical protein
MASSLRSSSGGLLAHAARKSLRALVRKERFGPGPVGKWAGARFFSAKIAGRRVELAA